MMVIRGKAYKDLTGARFGLLTVLGYSHSNNGCYWSCLCDCGGRSTVSSRVLTSGLTRSCGCGSLAAALENFRRAREQKRIPYPYSQKLKDLYSNMIDRCTNPLNKRWKNYGGRGIKVCNKWASDRRAFYKWAAENGNKPGLQLDRINVNGNYSPRNCRFVDASMQMSNTTRNRFIKWRGQTKTVSQWARILGVNPEALQHRLNRHWSVERMMTQPFRGHHDHA